MFFTSYKAEVTGIRGWYSGCQWLPDTDCTVLLCRNTVKYFTSHQDNDHQVPGAQVTYPPASRTVPAPETRNQFSLSERETPLAEGIGGLLRGFWGLSSANWRQTIFRILLCYTKTKTSFPQSKQKSHPKQNRKGTGEPKLDRIHVAIQDSFSQELAMTTDHTHQWECWGGPHLDGWQRWQRGYSVWKRG